MQYNNILDQYYYHICVQKIGETGNYRQDPNSIIKLAKYIH